MRVFLIAASVLAMIGGAARADLIDTRVDTTAGGAAVDQAIGADEYGAGNAYSYRGGGGGFGGTVGNGVVYMNSDDTTLYVGFEAGNAVNDLVTILLDTRAGGYTDAMMDDSGDGGRRASSQQSINADDAYDANFLPDFSIIIGNFGTVFFQLEAAPTPLTFLNFDGTSTQPVREYAIPLATLGVGPGGNVDFFVAYIADSGFGSNESIPAYEPLNGGANPGFDPVSAGYGNFDRFTTIPEPMTLALVLVGALAGLRRR